MKIRMLLKAELRRTWVSRRRYLISTVTSLITFGVVSIVGWLGLRAVFFQGAGDYAASATLLWPLVLAGFGIAANQIEEDIEVGTIEQLYLSAPSVLRLLHIRSLVGFLDTLAFTTPLLLIGGYYLGWGTLGRWILTQVAPLWLSLYGLGLVLAGLTLRYRRLGALSNLLLMGVMALAVVSVPSDGVWPWLQHMFPMIGVSATSTWPDGWWLRYVAAILYLMLGVGAFLGLEAQAKRLGMIGKY